MVKNLKEFYNKRIRDFFHERFYKIYEINRKYSKPRIEMTTTVKVMLLILRIYLFTLIGILIFKFITLIK